MRPGVGSRPEWARPAVGGVVLGLLLALPQMYGVGYPVMYKATASGYALWFLIVLAVAKTIACSLTIGIGGSGGVFAPSLFAASPPGSPSVTSSIACSVPLLGSPPCTRWWRWARCLPPPPGRR